MVPLQLFYYMDRTNWTVETLQNVSLWITRVLPSALARPGEKLQAVPSHMEYGHFEFTPSFFYIYSPSGFGLKILVNVVGQDLQLSEGFLVLLESTWTDSAVQ